MSKRNITFFQVKNGNCCLMSIDDKNIVFDLHGTGEDTSYDLIKPFLPKKDDKFQLDVLCISHGDKDHCGGFKEFKKAMDAENLVIGSIWHPNYDRTKIQDEEELPEDYIALHEEILFRKSKDSSNYGEIEIPLTAWDDETTAFKGLEMPEDFSLHVLSPYIKDDEDDWDVNDISLVINVEISGLSILFPGDSGSEIWQERIISHTLKKNEKKDWANAHILVASHHGSFSFFGKDRDDVRNADPVPENYEALDFIKPKKLIISANDSFPLSGDSSGDQPPHYAAWKWYHKWFQENNGIDEDDKHPDCFKYTSDGHIRLEYSNKKWQFQNDWTISENKNNTGDGFIYRGGKTNRMGAHYG